VPSSGVSARAERLRAAGLPWGATGLLESGSMSRGAADGDPEVSPESLFGGWLARRLAGDMADIEEACRAHPRAAERLRSLKRQHDELEELRRRFGLAGSIAERLATHFGSEVDPKVELESEDQGDSTSKLLGRLSGRGPASSRYRLKDEVAVGGMGAILRVWDEDLRRHLAMKVVLGKGDRHASGAAQPVDRRQLARFLEEAQVTGQLDHPGIVPVHELGLDAQGRVYFTMKLVKGRDLKAIFDLAREEQEGWSQVKALGVLLKVCEAMSYAHDKGVIHRDLKPANVMVGRYGEVYVMDWGLAKILERKDDKDIRLQEQPGPTLSAVLSERSERAGETPDSPLYTMDGDVVGTPAYMPPEQAAGDIAAMGPHSDVYALGAMLYHLLAGHMPYVTANVKASNYAVWRWVTEGPPRSLVDEAPDAPSELVAICEKAMAREAKLRYPDMAALADDFSAFIEGRVVGAYESGAWAEARKWVRRNKPLAASLAGTFLLLVVGLVSSLLLKAQSDSNAERADAKAQEARDNLVIAQRNEQEATANATLARRNEAEAKAQQQRAESETAKVLRLSDVKVLQELQREADELWPAYPDKIESLESWLDRARKLADNLPGHLETLAQMRAGARPWSEVERQRDRETHPRAGELSENMAELEGLIAQLERGLKGSPGEAAQERVAELEPLVASLSQAVESRQTWGFDAAEDQWHHDVLAELIGNLEEFESGLLAEDAITPDHGWSVAKRLSYARTLQAGYAEGGDSALRWAAALPAIRDAYPGLELAPQMGLLPIGPDPQSGLWEFAHLMSGSPAERGTDGRLLLREESGVVLVLLPRGSFWMGAQSGDPAGRNHDPQAQSGEGPVHEVELSAFLLSKYEMTQGQWLRLAGRNPSFYGPHNWGPEWLAGSRQSSLLHPIELVSWHDCMEWLPRAGLSLPSEAQWEFGARGGTQTAWWMGAEKESLAGKANLADKYALEHGGSAWGGHELWLDDGATGHAPIGTYAANAFGLHEVHGNLWEWCLDGYDASSYARSSRLDPVSAWVGAANRVARGGGFSNAAINARSANRGYYAPTSAPISLGARPALGIRVP
jgi:serine/threonine protein kinase/formylglycine-generating enzyme required for sulfatase activity